jgi:hypothetical protein
MNCSGYGRRLNQATVCACTGTSGAAMGHALCPQEFDLSGGMQLCHCGISDFIGSPGGTCSGHYVHENPDLTRESRSASGRYTGCSADYVVVADPAENWPGTMMNCVPQSSGPMMPEYPSGEPMGTVPMGYPPMLEAPAMMPSVSCGT